MNSRLQAVVDIRAAANTSVNTAGKLWQQVDAVQASMTTNMSTKSSCNGRSDADCLG